MSPRDSLQRLRLLRPEEREEAAALAYRAFDGNRFYERALGFRRQDLPFYWDSLLRLLLASKDARVYALDHSGRIGGLVLAAFDGFPSPLAAARFLARLLLRVGLVRLVGYLRFVRAYDRALDRSGLEPGTEGRCLWLMVDPRVRSRLGSSLVREVRVALHREGISVGTGLVDAGDPRILRFYRGLGFRIGEPFAFLGGTAATIEIPTEPADRSPEWYASLHERIDGIDAARWDSLPGDPLNSHATLAALEAARLPGVRIRALTLEDAEGRWVAAAPVATIRVDGALLTHGLFRSWIRAVRLVRPDFVRTELLVCGTPLSVGNAPARIAKGVLGTRVYRELGRVLSGLADEERIPWLAFKEIPDHELAAAASLRPEGWVLAASEPNMTLPLRWPTFAAYLRALRSHYRYKIRRDERIRAAAGIHHDIVPLAEGYDPAAHALYEAVLARAHVRLEHLTPEFFPALGRAFPNSARLLRFWKEDRLVGWVALLAAGDTVYDLFHGIDYQVNGVSALYFEEIARTIGLAITRGARELRLGQSSEDAKSRFGAVPIPLWIAVRHRSRWIRLLLRVGSPWLFAERPLPRRNVFADPSPPTPCAGPVRLAAVREAVR